MRQELRERAAEVQEREAAAEEDRVAVLRDLPPPPTASAEREGTARVVVDR